MQLLTMTELNLDEQRVLIRVDFNVPMSNRVITSDARIQAALPTIKCALEQNASVLLVSHLGRPEGLLDAEFSLAPIARRLSELLNHDVPLITDWIHGVSIAPGQVALAENVRFLPGEEHNSAALSKQMASLCDIYVMDAFATAHRAQASTYGIACYAPIACAGPLVMAEIEALNKVMKQPARPMLAIVGGSKVSTKIGVLRHLLDKVDNLIVGGGIANTLLAAAGYPVGRSLVEINHINTAKTLLDEAKSHGTQIPLPLDVVVAPAVQADADASVKAITDVDDTDMILDIGPKTVAYYGELIAKAGTVLWNGPVGVFEVPAFAKGTTGIAQALAASGAFSLVGGGDTIAALEQCGLIDQMSYVSTAGGAFLEYIEGKTLPALAILQERATHSTLPTTYLTD